MADRRLPVKNSDLHGSAPDEARAALLLIDVINDLEFEGGAGLLVHALPMAARLAAFKQRAKAAGLPAIYVNDNFGRWQSDLAKLVQHCLGPEICGRRLVEQLQPEDDDYFVLKPKHSGFFSTVLETLLDYLRAETPHPDWTDHRELRAVHGRRRSHARLPHLHTGGLRCLRRSC